MAINVTFKIKDDILFVTASGKDDSLEEVEEYGMKVLGQGILSNCRKILCNEIDLEYNISVIDTYESAKFISENAPKICKVALVCNPKNLSDAKFWETVSFNRGLTVKVFTDISEAESWLNL